MFGGFPMFGRASVNVVIEIAKNGYIVRYSYIKKRNDDLEIRREDVVEDMLVVTTEEEVVNLLKKLKEQFFNG